jgi:hypothetical protein
MIILMYILLLALVIIVKYIGGVMILTCMYLCSNGNFNMHTSRGSLVYIFLFGAYILQIHMLSSNTKKGEIERAFSFKIYFGAC